jgi:hypothetical protein
MSARALQRIGMGANARGMRVVADNTAAAYGAGLEQSRDPTRVSPREGLLRRMRVVAKARFQANKRLSAKATASNLALQLTNLYTIAIGIFLVQFQGTGLVKAQGNVLSYVSLMASVFVQMMALIESLKDYAGQARQMHECAVKVNGLCQQLELDGRQDGATLEAYRRADQAILEDAEGNHDAIDYRAARLDPDRWQDRTRSDLWAIARWRIAYAWNVYGLTSAMLASPIVALVLLARLGLG